MNKLTKAQEGETGSEKKCNHFMVWNIQGGYSYYRCDKCNYIDGDKTFKDELSRQKKEIIEEAVKIVKEAPTFYMAEKGIKEL